MGPGDLTMGAHGANEFVPVEQVIKCAKTYASMILRWCSDTKGCKVLDKQSHTAPSHGTVSGSR